MKMRDRVARLEGRFLVASPIIDREWDTLLDPAEHERLFGYRMITVDMTAVEAARHYFGMIRSKGHCRIDDVLPAGMTAQAAAALYRVTLG